MLKVPVRILETQALTRSFGSVVAADRVSMAVEAGETFGLLGPNGAGKTTVIKMLTTLLPPTSGTALVAGFDVRTQANRVRRVIGYVPQMISVDGELTGFENLSVFARLYDVPRAEQRDRIEEALEFSARALLRLEVRPAARRVGRPRHLGGRHSIRASIGPLR
jgi:ABC-2 type transport system ATP-binding protein